MVENGTDPKFVPITRSSREIKLLFREHYKDIQQSKSMNKKIANTLKSHAYENRKAM